MSRMVALLIATALGGCAAAPAGDGGVATLDALNQAQSACAARGGVMKLKPYGDPASIDAYACERK
jgi:hypothetical protein